MDSYKQGYTTYELASRIAHGRGIVYKSVKTRLYKIASKPPPLNPYNRAREKVITRRLISYFLT